MLRVYAHVRTDMLAMRWRQVPPMPPPFFSSRATSVHDVCLRSELGCTCEQQVRACAGIVRPVRPFAVREAGHVRSRCAIEHD